MFGGSMQRSSDNIAKMDSTALPPPPPMLAGLRLGVAGASLKEKWFKAGKITDYTLDQFMGHRGKNVMERLREMAYIHMHTPQTEEVELLNVSTYRMSLLVTQDVLYLCGGLVGVRFSSEDLVTIQRLTKKMSTLWNDNSVIFKNMSAACKKYTLKEDADAADPDGCAASVRRLHDQADQYVTLFGELQTIIKEKQTQIDPSARSDIPQLDADPESKQGRKIPEWLSTLLEKHAASKSVAAAAVPATTSAQGNTGTGNGNDTDSKPTAVRGSQVRVGELSVFLSGCVSGIEPCNESESEAMSILVQASNDNVVSVSNADIHAVTEGGNPGSCGHSGGHSGAHSSHGRCGSPTLFSDVAHKSRRYWARRFYNFLSNLSELKAAVKDEAALDHL